MKLKKRLLLVALFTQVCSIFAQTPVLTKKDSIITSSWIVGLGYHFVDDSGDVFDHLLDTSSSWSVVPYPSRFSIGKYLENGLGIELIGSYTKYDEGTRVDKQEINESKHFYALDSRLSYDLNNLIGETGFFDPYVGTGIGFTHASNKSRVTANAVVGFRTWLSDRIGLDFNASGKWATNFSPETTNYKQYAAGVVYRFGVKKELTEEGKEKQALIEKLEQERINDSIALAQEQEKALQERLAAEREKARLAQLEEEKAQAKAEERKKIKDAISSLEKINFSFASSTVRSDSKNTISKLAKILEQYPELVIEISAHTDSRGSKVFNQQLSEKRLKATLEYLLTFDDVNPDHVIGKAFGEDKLNNNCDDNTKCTEEQHKENRRSEFKVLDN